MQKLKIRVTTNYVSPSIPVSKKIDFKKTLSYLSTILQDLYFTPDDRYYNISIDGFLLSDSIEISVAFNVVSFNEYGVIQRAKNTYNNSYKRTTVETYTYSTDVELISKFPQDVLETLQDMGLRELY